MTAGVLPTAKPDLRAAGIRQPRADIRGRGLVQIDDLKNRAVRPDFR